MVDRSGQLQRHINGIAGIVLIVAVAVAVGNILVVSIQTATRLSQEHYSTHQH